MSPRLRTILLIAGAAFVIGTAGGFQPLSAGASTAEPPATKPAHKESDEHDASHDSSHDADQDAEEPDSPHGHADADEHAAPPADEHAPPKAVKPGHGDQDEHAAPGRKAGEGKSGEAKPADGAGRKPLFNDKSKEGKEPGKAGNSDENVTADRALELLREGNQRWATGDLKNPNIDQNRRTTLADKGQKPFATILTCADSRIPVERIFDRGVGEIFTIRVAGNVAGPSETGTVEYGVEHLHTPVLVVMGHTKCGAVAAAASGAPLHGKVAELVAGIAPAVERVKRSAPDATGDALAALTVKENVWQTIFDLYKSSDELRSEAREGKVRVVGAIYDIASGKVEWLGEHPWQSQILDALQVKTAAVEATSDSH